MEDENERDNILFGFELEAREDDSNYVENQLSPEQVACKLGEVMCSIHLCAVKQLGISFTI